MKQNSYSTSTTFNSDGLAMYQLIEELYPICRSITGNGVRKTLSLINKIVPLDIHEIPTGTKIFDWEIPEEWNIEDGWIKENGGKKVIDFKQLNLHILNYSIPIDKVVTLEELSKHLYTLPDYPNWVPYRTSYHNRTWGFCMSHKQFKSLKKGNYHVKIDSKIEHGSLTYGEIYIPGESNEEVLLSCHICHPSLCNDNLSGIAVSIFLAKYIKTIPHRYSYRFLFIPGTIGSICWLSKNEKKIKNIKYGLVLTLLGDSSEFHYKKSRQGNAAIDKIIRYLLKFEKNAKIENFSPYGYDERQYCSPGINLPVGRFSRKPHGEFPEYHTSADNLQFINKNNLSQSLSFLQNVITLIEEDRKWINLFPKCEPQLGKRGLYKTIGGESGQKEYQMAILWILNYSDGTNSLLDIAELSGINFHTITKAAQLLHKHSLLKPSKDDTSK